MTQAVTEVLEKVRKLTKRERTAFVKRLLEEADLDGDVRDSLAVIARRNEPRQR